MFFSVYGISETSKCLLSSLLIVSETPFTQTDPLKAKYLQKESGNSIWRVFDPFSESILMILAIKSTCPVTKCPPSRSLIFRGSSRLTDEAFL